MNYQLTGKGSVSFHDEDGNEVVYLKGDVISGKQFQGVPKRQQGFFAVQAKVEAKIEAEVQVEVEAEVKAEGPDEANSATDPAELIAAQNTVDELKDILDEADVDYSPKAKKAELIAILQEFLAEDE